MYTQLKVKNSDRTISSSVFSNRATSASVKTAALMRSGQKQLVQPAGKILTLQSQHSSHAKCNYFNIAKARMNMEH